jgi:hypothetical protein
VQLDQAPDDPPDTGAVVDDLGMASPSGRSPATAMAACVRSGVTSAAKATGSTATESESARARQSASVTISQSAGISDGHQLR